MPNVSLSALLELLPTGTTLVSEDIGWTVTWPNGRQWSVHGSIGGLSADLLAAYLYEQIDARVRFGTEFGELPWAGILP